MKKILAAIALIYAAYHLVSFMNPPVYESKLEYHRVIKGDTIWVIAESYFDKQDKINNLNEWIYTVRKANGFHGKRHLQIGDIVVMPLQCRVRQ